MLQARKHVLETERKNPHDFDRTGFLRLDMNENVDGLPETFVREVLAEIDGQFLARYPDYSELERLLAEEHGLSREQICLTNGSDGGIRCIFDAFVEDGDRIVFTDPTFAMYPVYASISGAISAQIPYNIDFSFPMCEFLQKIERGAKIAIVVSPNNPLGIMLKNHELKCILDACERNDCLFLVDHAYVDFFGKTSVEIIKNNRNIVILHTFSKFYAMASLRLGYIAGSHEAISVIKKVRPTYDINGVAVKFAIKILKEKNIKQEMANTFFQGKKYIINFLKENCYDYIDGNANFILVKTRCGSDDAKIAFQKRNILVASMSGYAHIGNYVRINVGSIGVMKTVCNALMDIDREVN